MADDDVDTIRAPEPGEGTDVGDARGARETVGAAVEARAAKRKPAEPAAAPKTEEEVLKERYLTGPQDDGVAMAERARLNAQNSRYRGTAFGSMRLAALADVYSTPDEEGIDPARKKINADAREEYLGILGDLGAYDEMPSWSGLKEAGVSLAGSLGGSMTSPESFLGAASQGTTATVRTLKAAAQQAIISGVFDPLVQMFNMKAGVQDEYDPLRTVEAAGFGAVLGGGLHIAGESLGNLIGQRTLRKQLFDLGEMDPSFSAPQHAIWALDPRNGISVSGKFGETTGVPNADLRPDMLKVREGERPGAEPVLPRVPQEVSTGMEEGAAAPGRETSLSEVSAGREKLSGESATPSSAEKATSRSDGPAHGFEDTVAAEKERLSRSYGAAQPKAARLNEEARFSAFQKEAGVQADILLSRYGFDPKEAHALYEHYDRAPGEHPDEALKRATVNWYDAEERAALTDKNLSSEWRADMAELERHFASGEGEGYGTTDAGFRAGDRPGEFGPAQRSNERTPPRGDDLYGRPESDIPFESGVPAREGGAVAEGGAPKPGEPGQTDAGGATGATGGERRAAAEGPRGERLNAERTAQGEQTLLPGVEPVTDKDRLAVQANRPLRGGDKPLDDGLFDTGARKQQDAFALEAPKDQAMADRGGFQGEIQRDSAGIPHTDENGVPYSPQQEVALRSLQQQAVDLSEAIGFNLRQGRVTMKDALGMYKGASDTVRMKQIPDFAVVSHEAGHAIEAKIGKELTALTEKHTFELTPLDYDPSKARLNEGFAEWMRMRIGNPAYARNVAPRFSNEFEAFMNANHPEMLSAINAAADAYRAWREASSVDSIGSVVQHKSRDPKGIAKVVQQVKDEGLPATISTFMEKGYDGLIDKFAAVTRVTRELTRMASEKEGGDVSFLRAHDPDYWVRSARYAANGARVQLQHGIVPWRQLDSAGVSMTEALTDALGKPSRLGKWDQGMSDHFDTYNIARMGEYLWRRYEAGQMPREPVPFSKGDAVQAMQDLERQYPQFRAASDKVHEFTRNLLKKAYDAGEITADAYKGASEYEFYVPLLRDRTDKPGAGPGGAPANQPRELVNRRTGSMRDILSPVESIKMMTMWAERQIRQGEALRSLAALADIAGPGAGKYVERIPAHEARVMTADLTKLIEGRAADLGLADDAVRSITSLLGQEGEEGIIQKYFTMERAAAKGEPILFYREGGELQALRVTNAKEGMPLYEAMTLAPEPIKDVWVNIMAVAASTVRTGIVSAPTFLFSNFFKDQLQVAMMHPGYIPLLSGLPGIRDELGQTSTALRRAYLGGPSGGSATGVIQHGFDQGVNDLAKKGYAVQHFTSVKGFLDVMNLTESATRNSLFNRVYKAGLAKGLTEFEAGVEAAHHAKDIMDFDRSGSHTQGIRSFLPFFNANVQGEEKVIWRTMIQPILRKMRDQQFTERDHAEFRQALNTWMTAAGGGIALGAGWAALNWEKQQYRDASPEVKGTHIVIPLGYDVATVPKPYELGMGFTLGEFMYGMWAKDDPRMASQFGRATKAALLPPNPLMDLPLIAPTMALQSGVNPFTNRPIVPDRLQKLIPEEQYTDATSPMAKSIGKIMGWSPMKVEYAMGAYFGTWGRDVFAASNGLSEDSPAKELDNTLFLRRFFKDPYKISETTKQFWELASTQTGKFNQDVATYNEMMKHAVTRGQPPTEAREFLAKMPEAEKSYVTLKSGATRDGKPMFTPEQKRLHPLQHAYDAVTLLNEFARELSTNTQSTWAKRGQLPLSQETRRDLLRDVRTLTALEMRNSLAIMKTEGYADRQILPPTDILEHIKSISPEVAKELTTRYATNKIYSTETIQRSWPTLSKELVQHGTAANLGRITSNAQSDGYQFQGHAVKKPTPIRMPIVPAAAPQPQP